MKITTKTRISRFFAMLALLIVGLTSKAENTLSIGNFSIVGNEPVQVPILLTNSDPVAALQFQIVMPENLTLVAIERNAERFAQGQTFSGNTENGNVMVASLQGNNFIGNSGPIAFMTVKANNAGTPSTETITLSGIKLSTPTGTPVESNKTATGVVSVGYGTATVTATEHFYINPDGSATVAVSLQNDFDINGIETVVTLSSGLSIRQGSVELTSRATGSAVATLTSRGNGVYGITVAGFGDNGQAFNGTSGEVFTFVVEASSDFTAPTGTVTISKFGCSRNGTGITNVMVWANDGGNVVVNVTNGLPKYQEAQASIKGLRDSLQSTLEQIKEQCPDVYEQFTGQEISNDLDALEEAVNTAYADLTLTPNYDQVMAPSKDINAAIGSLLEKAIAAQAMYELNQKNAEAKAKADAEIQVLEESLASTLSQIKEQYPNVAGQEQLSGANVQAMIDDLKSQVAGAYENQKLADNYDTVMAPVPSIEEAIADLLTKAAAAQEQYDKEQAQKALDEALANAKAVVSALEKALDKNTKYVDANYPNVAQLFKAEEYEISEAIDALNDAIQAAYDNGTLATDYEAVVTEVADGIQTRIDSLITDAKEANDAYNANEAQKKAADQTVAGLQSQLEQALKTIAKECPNVADQFTGNDINIAINNLQNAINEAYSNGTLVADYESVVTTPAENISSDITALVAAAMAAQKAYDEAVQEALDAKKKEADAVVNQLKDQLAAALSTIETECPDVADSFPGISIQNAINNLQSAIDEAYENGSLIDNYENVVTSAASSIGAQIEKLIEEAKAAQEAHSTLEGAYSNAKSKIAELQASLNETLEYIKENCPDVADSFTGSSIQKMIDNLTSNVENAYKNGTLVADYNTVMSPVASIETAIDNLLADAKAAQKAIDDQNALDAARDAALAVVANLQSELAAALEQIESEYPDVASQFTGEDVKAMINTIRSDALSAYNSGTIIKNYDIIVTEPAEKVEAAIADLLAKAAAAQEASDAQKVLDKALADANNVINGLENELAQALETIKSQYPDVADEFNGKDIEDEIAGLEEEIKDAYNNGSLVEDYNDVVTEPASEITKAIEDLLIKAAAAQEASDAQKALDKALANANSVIEDLENDLNQALETIKSQCPDVADEFNGKDIEEEIAGLKEEIEEAYNNGTLVDDYEDVVTVPATDISAAIADLLAKAEAAQEASDAQKTLDQALADANNIVEGLENNLAQALETIKSQYPDVADEFNGKDIEDEIAGLKEEIEEAYNNGTLVEDYENVVTDPASEIAKAIEDLLIKAAAAQEASEAQKALDKALADANNVVDGLENNLAQALETIKSQYPDVADEFNGKDIAEEIAGLEEEIKNAYNNGSLVEDFNDVVTGSASEIAKSIEDLLSAAEAAQKAIDDENARKDANEAAYQENLDEIQELLDQLDAALKEIEEKFPLFDPTELADKIREAIEEQKEKADEAYADVEEEGEYDNTVDSGTIIGMIENMLKEAEGYNGIEAIYGEYDENEVKIFTIDGMQIPAPQRGKINIIVYPNGKTKNVLVK